MFMVFVNKLNVIVCKDRKMQQNPDELLPFLEKIKKIRAEGNNKKGADYPEDNQHLAEPLTRLELVTYALRMRCSTN